MIVPLLVRMPIVPVLCLTPEKLEPPKLAIPGLIWEALPIRPVLVSVAIEPVFLNEVALPPPLLIVPLLVSVPMEARLRKEVALLVLSAAPDEI